MAVPKGKISKARRNKTMFAQSAEIIKARRLLKQRKKKKRLIKA